LVVTAFEKPATVGATWRLFLPFLFILLGIGAVATFGQQGGSDWTQFGGDQASSSSSNSVAGITVANVASLSRHQIHLDGTVDASVIYLRGVNVMGAEHDVFFMTTTYGKTIAVDANQGSVLWEYTPPKYQSWEGSRQITNSTPIADSDRQNVYAAAPDGTVQKLAISDGHVLWRTAITLLPVREKIASPLREFRGHIVAVTDGYVGDQPPYQGHVAVLDAQTGKLLHVWNGPYDGKASWGDTTIELNPDATEMLGNYTPTNNAELNERDLDEGSTSPVLLGGDFLAQGGKDGQIHLLSIKAMAGTEAHQGHEGQTVSTPSGSLMLTAAAVWHHGTETWMFAADRNGTAAWTLENGKLVQKWKSNSGGTSPLVADGLLFVYNPSGVLRVYDSAKGTLVTTLACGGGHWNSPIVVDGKIALPEGNANQHVSTGVLDIWTLPAGH
jgi:outer membrane protein assembly factor BamB